MRARIRARTAWRFASSFPTLGRAGAARPNPNSLTVALRSRLATGGVALRVGAQVATEAGSSTDPAAGWPTARELLGLGIISLAGPAKVEVKEKKALLFNP